MKNILRRTCARIAEHEFWLVWVFGAPLLFASNLPGWLFATALATIPFFWLARKIARGQWSVATPLDVPLAILLGLGLVSLLVSAQRSVSLQAYGIWVGGIALYYGIVNGVTRATFRKGVWLVVALGFGMAMVGLLGLNYANKYLSAPQISAWLPQADLSFLNARGFTANIVAGAVAPVVPLAFALAFLRRDAVRGLILLAAVVMLAVVVVTQSRGALLGLGAGFVILGVWRFPRLTWLVAVFGLVILVAGAWLGPQRASEIIFTGDANDSSLGRVELWNRALLMLRDFPFTGIGLNSFETVVQTFYPLFQNLPGVPVPHAHNMYLQMGVDFGIGGFVAFIGLVVTVLLTGFTLLRSGREKSGWLAAGLVAGYVVFLIHGLLDAVYTSSKVSVIIWLMVALILFLSRQENQARAAEQGTRNA